MKKALNSLMIVIFIVCGCFNCSKEESTDQNPQPATVIDILHDCNTINVVVHGDFFSSDGLRSTDFALTNEDYYVGYDNLPDQKIPLVWNGTSFTANGTFTTDVRYVKILQCSGTVSQDGKTLVSFSIKRSYTGVDVSSLTELAGINIPFDSIDPYLADGVLYKLDGSVLQSHLTTIGYTSSVKNKYGTTLKSSYSYTNWESSEYKPGLKVHFANEF